MTPVEINLEIEIYMERLKQDLYDDDYRTGMICATVANVNRDPKKKREPWKPEDFMPQRGPKEELKNEPQKPLWERVADAFDTMNTNLKPPA